MKKLNLFLSSIGMMLFVALTMTSTPTAAGPFTDCMNKILDAGKTPTYQDRIACFGGSGTASAKPFPLWKVEEPNPDPGTDPGTEPGTDPVENPKHHHWGKHHGKGPWGHHGPRGPKNPTTPTTGDPGQTTSGESNGNESGSDSGTSGGGGSDGGESSAE